MLKFNAKYVKSTPKFNANFIRLALIALNLCKIYAKFNAKYVRSTLKFNTKICKFYAKIQRKFYKIGADCVEFIKDLR